MKENKIKIGNTIISKVISRKKMFILLENNLWAILSAVNDDALLGKKTRIEKFVPEIMTFVKKFIKQEKDISFENGKKIRLINPKEIE
jgi:hypothetical protein